jgi:hypothetical protein
MDVFTPLFSALVDVRFCWGFWQKWGAKRGVLMVNLW